MLNTLKNAWRIPDLRKKLIFTVLIILIYRIGSVIPVPFVNGEQMQLYFNNVYAKPLTAINLAALNRFEDGAVVDAAALIEAGIIHACPYGLKVLSNGTLTKKITVKAAAFSESAKEKIEQAGGKAEVV